MKVLFLDIDGVLNSGAFYRERFRRSTRPPSDPLYRENHIDPRTIPLLNELLSRSGAVCVLSSTWRILFKIAQTLPALRHHGFTGEIIDCTPDVAGDDGPIVAGQERGSEIQQWLDANPGVESFVILDDSADMAHLLPRLVRTSNKRGLEREHVERAVALFGDRS